MEEQNNTPVDRLKRIDKLLDEYEVKIGLEEFSEEKTIPEVNKYLNMSREQIEKLDIEECAEAAILLGGFSFHLQRCYNREVARVNWATNTLKKIISGREQQYSGSWDSQFHQAVKEDKYTDGIFQIKNYAQQRADRLTFLATSVKSVCDLFVNLQRAKAMK